MSQTTEMPSARRVVHSVGTTVAEQSTAISVGLQHRESSIAGVAGEQRLRVQRVSQVLWVVLRSVEALIGLRVLLKLIGANPDTAFARFVYDFSGLFLAPFVGLTDTPSAGGMVLEIPSIIAMLVFAGIGWGVVRMILPLFSHPPIRRSRHYHF